MLTHVGTQTINTERLILRRFEYSDIDSMLRNWIADEKTQWDYGEPCYTTYEAVKELFDTKYIASYSKDDYYRWAVIEKESGECIGQIAYFTVDTSNQHGEIEYVIKLIKKENYKEIVDIWFNTTMKNIRNYDEFTNMLKESHLDLKRLDFIELKLIVVQRMKHHEEL